MRIARYTIAAILSVAWPTMGHASACMARLHPTAQAYSFDGKNMFVVLYDNPKNVLEVEMIDPETAGGPWVLRQSEFFWRMHDVDLVGDCSSVKRERYHLPVYHRPPGMCGPYWRGFHPYYVRCPAYSPSSPSK